MNLNIAGRPDSDVVRGFDKRQPRRPAIVFLSCEALKKLQDTFRRP